MPNNATVLARVATAIIVVVVVLVGGILVIADHGHTLTYADYFKSVATAVGLLAVGYGIDAHSKP